MSRFALPLLVLFGLVQSTLAFDYSKYAGKTTVGGTQAIVPNRWIVEFNSTAAMSSLQKRSNGDLETIHEHVYRQLKQRGVTYDVVQTYDSELFMGASLNVQGADIMQIATMTGVTTILPVHYIQRPTPHSDAVWGDASDVAALWKRKSDNERRPGGSSSSSSSTSKSSTSSSSRSAAPTSNGLVSPTSLPYSAKQNGLIGADKVNAEGNTGIGIKVAIIDSGVDYTHPNLGGCFGPGCKIAGGYDYVGDEFDGSNTPVPSNDPLDQCYGHGTFVAGIIGASGPNKYNVTGVAPGASQYHYRIFSCYGSTTDDIVAKAMQDAYTQGNDVINLSLGEVSSWSESMLSVVASRIAANGVPVVAVGGNEGQDGTFYNEAPGSGSKAWSVGSVDNTFYPAQQASISSGGAITYFSLRPLLSGSYPLITLPDNSRGCPFPSNSLDLAGSVLVVPSSTSPNCNTMLQARAFYAAGVKQVLVIAQPNAAPVYSQGFPFAYAQVNNTDGALLLKAAAAGANITFGFYPTAYPNTLTGGFRSSFSSLGPTNDLYLKPQFLAPGGFVVNVQSLALTPDGFAQSSGTSFSCPFVTGATALYLSAKGGRSNASVRTILSAFEGTAKTIGSSAADSSLSSAAEQGSGIVNVYDAIHASFSISPSEILLNDTANMAPLQYITVKNTGSKLATFKVSNVKADTIYSFDAGSFESAIDPFPEVAGTTNVAFFPSVIILPPGGTGIVGMYFTAPKGLDASRLPVYSGYIQVNSGSGSQQIPYLGVAQKMISVPVLDSTSVGTDGANNLPALTNGNGDVQTGIETYTLKDGDAPTLIYRLWTGTRVLFVDLVQAKTTVKPTISKRGSGAGNRNDDDDNDDEEDSHSILGNAFQAANWWLDHRWGSHSSSSSSSFRKVPILGNLYEADYISRNSGYNPSFDDGNQVYSFAFDGTFTNGTNVPNGEYKFLVRALRISGNPRKESDYDSWLSPVVKIAA